MNRLSSIRITDASTTLHVGSRQMCSDEAQALYMMWPTTMAGAELMYALAFAAAQQRVAQLDRHRRVEPSMN